jgi:hypothetical protein
MRGVAATSYGDHVLQSQPAQEGHLLLLMPLPVAAALIWANVGEC